MRLNRFNTLMEGDGGEGGQGGGGGGEFDFRQHVSEDMRENPALADIKDIDGLVSSFVNAQGMIGNSIRIPGEDAGEDQWSDFNEKLMKVPGMTRLPTDEDPDAMGAFYNKLGRPEAVDGYKIDIPDLGKDLQINDESFKAFKEVAHATGLTQKQLEGVTKWYFKDVMDQQAQLGAIKDRAIDNMRKEWGGDYDRRMGAAQATLKQFGDEQTVNDLANSLDQHPGLAKTLSNIGLKLMEGNFIQGDGTTPQDTVDEMKAKIAEIKANTKGPYWDKSNPAHDETVSRVNNLYAKLEELGAL